MTIWSNHPFYMYVSNVLTLNLLLIINDDFCNTWYSVPISVIPRGVEIVSQLPDILGYFVLLSIYIYFVYSSVSIYWTFTRFIGQCPAWLAISTPVPIPLHAFAYMFHLHIISLKYCLTGSMLAHVNICKQ